MSGKSNLNLIQSDFQQGLCFLCMDVVSLYETFCFVFVFTDLFVHSFYFLQQLYSNKIRGAFLFV